MAAYFYICTTPTDCDILLAHSTGDSSVTEILKEQVATLVDKRFTAFYSWAETSLQMLLTDQDVCVRKYGPVCMQEVLDIARDFAKEMPTCQ